MSQEDKEAIEGLGIMLAALVALIGLNYLWWTL